MIIGLIKFHTFRFYSHAFSLSLSIHYHNNTYNLDSLMSVDRDRNERSGFIASKMLPLSFFALPCRNMTKFFMKMKLLWVLIISIKISWINHALWVMPSFNGKIKEMVEWSDKFAFRSTSI